MDVGPRGGEVECVREREGELVGREEGGGGGCGAVEEDDQVVFALFLCCGWAECNMCEGC